MNNIFSKADWSDITGTSFHMGYVKNSANEINEVLGKYEQGDYEKTFHEWDIKTPAGVAFSVYDYKFDPFDNEVVDYHIGTKTSEETHYVVRLLKEAGLNAYVKKFNF